MDIKSLVSHIVRGDGLDKCRICMGDTSQGQVYLTDTVMMDGDKAVTLSELLEVTTGVEVCNLIGYHLRVATLSGLFIFWEKRNVPSFTARLVKQNGG